jgi:hypothetical protein
MNLTNKVLKLLGMSLASTMLDETVPKEQKLWRAVVTLALEDVLNASQGRTEAVLKAESHDWFVGNTQDFQNVCFNAGLDPDWVRDRYLLALDTGIIKFTKKQHLAIRYSKLYEQFRNEKDPKKRKKLQKTVERMRQKLFKN